MWCLKCDNIYIHESDLFRHCKTTGHTFPSNNKTQPDKQFSKCEICQKWIMSKEYHFEKYHSEKAKSFSCNYENCGKGETHYINIKECIIMNITETFQPYMIHSNKKINCSVLIVVRSLQQSLKLKIT